MLGLPGAVRAVLDVRAPRLERLGVAAGRDLPVFLLARQPDLDVVGLGRREPHVAGAEDDRAIREPQPLQHRLGVDGQRLEHLVRLLRPRVGHQLHLVELVLADESAYVRAVGAGFAAEAGGVGGVFQRQVATVENLVPVQVRQRHLAGRDEIQVPLVADLEQVFLELRELPGADQRLRVGEERRLHLDVAVLAGVQLQHEVDERARQSGAGAHQDREPRTGQLGAAFEVDDAEGGSQIPVRLGLELEDGWVGVPPHLDIVRLTCTHRHALVRQVGQRHQDGATRLFDRLQPAFPRRDRGRVLLTGRHQFVRRLAVTFCLADPRPQLLLRAPGLLEHRDDLAALGVQTTQLLHQASEVPATQAESRVDVRCLVTKQRGIEHGLHSTYLDPGVLGPQQSEA